MEHNQVWLELVKGVPTALVSFVIGLIAAGIAFRQYQLAHAKFKLDLFEKRHEVFLKTWAFLSMFTNRTWFDPDDLLLFRQQVANAKFLFGADVATFVRQVDQKAVAGSKALAAAHIERDAVAKALAQNEHDQIVEWAKEHLLAIQNIFAPYMDLSNWR